MPENRSNYPDAFGGSLKNDKNAEFTIVGVPFDDKSTYRKGSAEGPDKIREVSTSDSINSYTESEIDLLSDTSVFDSGNIEFNNNFPEYFDLIERKVNEIAENDSIPVLLGGDHSITYPAVKGISNKYEDLNLVWLDAHPDIYPKYDGDPYSHACPLARILELNKTDRIVQAGIRATTRELDELLVKNKVEVIRCKDFCNVSGLKMEGPTYLTIDIDILDPAFAPGVGNPVPGGICTRKLIDVINSFEMDIIGFDIVEVNPGLDNSNITAMAAAKILMETIGRIVKLKNNSK
ncbi:agmatinase [candidate division KSB1 bacterium]